MIEITPTWHNWWWLTGWTMIVEPTIWIFIDCYCWIMTWKGSSFECRSGQQLKQQTACMVRYRSDYNGIDLKSIVSIKWPVGLNPTLTAYKYRFWLLNMKDSEIGWLSERFMSWSAKPCRLVQFQYHPQVYNRQSLALSCMSRDW